MARDDHKVEPKRDTSGEDLAALALFALLLLGFGFAGAGGGSGGGSAPLPPGTGPIVVVVNAWGFQVGPTSIGKLDTPTAELVAALGPPGRELVVDATNGPHGAVAPFLEQTKAAGWKVSVVR